MATPGLPFLRVQSRGTARNYYYPRSCFLFCRPTPSAGVSRRTGVPAEVINQSPWPGPRSPARRVRGAFCPDKKEESNDTGAPVRKSNRLRGRRSPVIPPDKMSEVAGARRRSVQLQFNCKAGARNAGRILLQIPATLDNRINSLAGPDGLD